MKRMFTAVEALVIIVVVAMMAAILIPNLIGQNNSAIVVNTGRGVEVTNKFIVDEIPNNKQAVVAWISSWKPGSVTIATGSGQYGSTLIIVGKILKD